MKAINEIIETTSHQQPTTTTKPQTFSDDDRDRIAYFFMRLRNVYGSEYDRQFSDENHLKMTKREWGKTIAKYSREQIDLGIDRLKGLKTRQPENYKWLDLGVVLNEVRSASFPPAAHKTFESPLLIESDQDKKKRLEFGLSEIRKLRGMFND